MEEVKASSPQHSPSGSGSSSKTTKTTDLVGTRFRLDPGNPRNPDYTRSPFIQKVSDFAVLDAIREAQRQQRLSEKNLFKPSFVYESKSTAPVVSFMPKVSSSPVYVMAANGIPTLYLKKKEQCDAAKTESDELTDTSSSEAGASRVNGGEGDENSNEKWEGELPHHLKSLKFMIELLNDRHSHPEEFASASLHDIPAPLFGSKYKDYETFGHLDDTWSDPIFPYPGDRIFAPIDPDEVVLAERPPFYADKKTNRRKDRSRNKSSESDLHCYRSRNYQSRTQGKETVAVHREIDEEGALIVEEISISVVTEDEEEELKYPEAIITDNNGNPNPKDVEEPTHNREFGNISPISEELSESEKDALNASCLPSSADTTMELSLISRLNCSSPILAHSPSLRKTPIFSGVSQDTPPSSGCRRIRNITRALHDISDREEEHHDSSSSSDDVQTESFEIDLADAGDGIVNIDLNASMREIEQKKLDGPEHQESLEELIAKRSVWETLRANIEAHIGDGNPAGFVSGPTEHPLQIPLPPEVEYPSYMYYDAPLAAIPKLP